MAGEHGFYIEMAKYVGFPILLFVILIGYHKSTVKTFKELLEAQSEEAKRTHDILKDMIATNLSNIAVLARIEQKIDSNLWCPYVRRQAKGDEK